jgi:DNA-binding MarR family transcriptional regulator
MSRAVSRRQAVEFVGLLQALLRELTAGTNDPASDLPLAQLRVCRVLCDGRQSMSAVSRELGVSLSAVTQIADRLQRSKLIDRVADDGDRRIRCLRLTKRGQTLLQRHDEERIRRTSAMLGQLPPEARKRAATVMESLGCAAAAARTSNRKPPQKRVRRSSTKAKS